MAGKPNTTIPPFTTVGDPDATTKIRSSEMNKGAPGSIRFTGIAGVAFAASAIWRWRPATNASVLPDGANITSRAGPLVSARGLAPLVDTAKSRELEST